MVCCPQHGRSLPDAGETSSSASVLSTTPSTTTEKQREKFEDKTATSLPNYPQCGLSNTTDFRVVGGVPANLGQFPWIAALGYRNTKNPDQPRCLCGGSLITEKHILTATHCVKTSYELYLARLGELDLYSNTEGANAVDIKIIDKKIHDGYNTISYTNDIALLILENKVEHQSYQREGSYCRTPLKDNERCINIKSCDVLLTLLQTQNQNPEVMNYLVTSVCGYSGKDPMVCCPRHGRSLPDAGETSSSAPVLPTTPSTTTEKQRENFEDKTAASLPNYPQCGLTNTTDFRVVGGVPANLGQFPWIAALGYRNTKNPDQPRWLCGGSLIAEKHILTAAHCVKTSYELYLARLGELDLYSNTEGANPVDIKIIDKKIHDGYNTISYTNHIALLTLENEVEHPSVWPVCLPSAANLRSQTFEKYHGSVAGWGTIYHKGPSSNVLQHVSLPIVSTATCKTAFSKIKNAVLDDRVLCAGYPNGGKDPCKGDSGGPFMLGRQHDGKFIYYLLGVVSYGIRCAEPGYYGVYTRTAAFLDWIGANIN